MNFLADIVQSYNKSVENYIIVKNDTPEFNVDSAKELSFHLRKWIIEYNNKIIPGSNPKFELGLNTDSPKMINKEDLFDE